jgi:4-hydroxy-3-polyprenylbenzoate decarboxylase
VKIILGITGASGAVYGITLLEELKKAKVQTHLIISEWGRETIEKETDSPLEEIRGLADYGYKEKDLSAAISSGSFPTDGMIVAPCSMKTLAGIASGYSDTLILRAAEVTLKEQRKLVLMVRESPLNAIHLENMLKLARLGVVILPPVPAFYLSPVSLDEMVRQTVGRVLMQWGIQPKDMKRWGNAPREES